MLLLIVKENQFIQKKILKKLKYTKNNICDKDWRGWAGLPKCFELIIGKKSSKMIKANFLITWLDL